MAKQQKVGVDQIHMQNAIKTLAANIRFASVDDPIRSIVVTSSVPNEGKTTVAISLAEAMASSGSKVLLVETDMRRRSVANSLGVHARSGVYAVLCGQVSLEDAVVSTAARGMYFLDCEPHIPNPDALLGSKRFRNLAESALSSFDYVILTRRRCPPSSTPRFSPPLPTARCWSLARMLCAAMSLPPRMRSSRRRARMSWVPS